VVVAVLVFAAGAFHAGRALAQTVTIGTESVQEVPAGATTQLQLYVARPDATPAPVDWEARWSIDPPTAGIGVGEYSGRVTVDGAVKHGTQTAVHARILRSGEVATASLYVYSRAVNPFIGRWTIDPHETCAAAAGAASAAPPTVDLGDEILRFRADSTFVFGSHPETIAGARPPVLDGRYLFGRSLGILRFGLRVPGPRAGWPAQFSLRDRDRILTLHPFRIGALADSTCAYTFHRLDSD
jgi:hypothetical protein